MAGGMLVFHMLGAIAEFERALVRERTAARLSSPFLLRSS
jgi:DNA invertase Pin-like site-specific DNA recombinase